jgi:DNA-binding CsgD family transcriptional regulator
MTTGSARRRPRPGTLFTSVVVPYPSVYAWRDHGGCPTETSGLESGVSTAVVGRTGETERLLALAGQAFAGRGAVVLVEGEPGIGKTTVLDVVADECLRRQARILRGRPDDVDRRLPFAAFGACLAAGDDPAVARVAGLMRGERAELSSAGAADHEFVVTEAIVELVETWASAGPVILLLDDLQWADPASLMVLHRVSSLVTQLRLLVVVAYRPSPRGVELETLLRTLTRRGAESLTLSPLDEGAVAQLVARLAGAAAGPALLDLVAGAAGNPLYVTELVTALLRDRRIATDATAAEVTGAVTAGEGSLLETISHRLDFLPRPVRDVLCVAAMLGRGFDLAELSLVLGTSTIELWEVVAESMRSGLLVDGGEKLLFRHDLIRQALAEDLPVAVRTALHLRIGQALVAAGAPPERVAEHVLAGASLDGRTLDWIIGTSPELVLRAPALAVDLLEHALTRTERDDPRAPVLRLRLARALIWAGRPAQAGQVAGAALAANHDGAQDAALRWLLAQARYQQGQLAEAIDEAERALAAPAVTAGDAMRFRGLTAQCYFYLGRMDAAAATGTALAEALAEHHPPGAGYGLYVAAEARLAQGRPTEALELIDRAIPAMSQGAVRPGTTPLLVRGICLMELDRLDEADLAFDAGMRESERGIGALSLGWYHWGRAGLRFFDGRWDDALSEISAGLDAVDYLGIGQVLRSVAALVAIHRADAGGSSTALGQPDRSPAGLLFGWHNHWARALMLEASGHPGQALEFAFESWERSLARAPSGTRLYLSPVIARLACRLRARPEIGTVAASVEEQAGSSPVGSMRGVAMLCRGVVDGDPDLLRGAAEAYGQAGRPLYGGHAWECAAAVLARAGATAEARTALDAALELYERLDAAWDACRAEADLAELGVRRGRRRAGRRPKTGWEALTDTERKVAELVADGRSNPEIATQMCLSRRTVQYHVSNILAKLGVSSRGEVAVGYRARGEEGGRPSSARRAD